MNSFQQCEVVKKKLQFRDGCQIQLLSLINTSNGVTWTPTPHTHKQNVHWEFYFCYSIYFFCYIWCNTCVMHCCVIWPCCLKICKGYLSFRLNTDKMINVVWSVLLGLWRTGLVQDRSDLWNKPLEKTLKPRLHKVGRMYLYQVNTILYRSHTFLSKWVVSKLIIFHAKVDVKEELIYVCNLMSF